jgi:hypothetical protein
MNLFGHFETLLHERFPDKKLVVRNFARPADEVAVRQRPSEYTKLDDPLAAFGADTYLAADILPDLGDRKGKGENLWKANNSYRRPTLTCPDALLQDLITIMALPCVEGLVEHPGQWQGLHTLPQHIGQEEVFERPQIYFRPNSKLPKAAPL